MSIGEVERRTVLKGALVLAATGFGVSGARTASAQEVPFSKGTERPKTTAPANATDAELKRLDGLGIRGIRPPSSLTILPAPRNRTGSITPPTRGCES